MQPAANSVTSVNVIDDAARQMGICNACRYCEGFCAVFPAMERRVEFTPETIHYLANLCHNCAECYYACQYAPPHEFAINVPKVFAEVRAQTYEHFGSRVFRWNPLWMLLPAVVLVVVLTFGRTAPDANFYAVTPHNVLVAVFGVLFAGIFVVHFAGFLRFWRATGGGILTPAALIAAAKDTLALKNLGSGGTGCTYPDEQHSQARRIHHHFTFYGFLLCFASTSVAAFYDAFLGWKAPYPYLSAPVLLGIAGGIGLLIGPAGLYGLKLRRDPAIGDERQDAGEFAFMGLLWLTSFTGLLLLALRENARFMGALLAVHLVFVAALFLTLPYGKFVHGVYRLAALLRSAHESARGQNQSRGQS